MKFIQLNLNHCRVTQDLLEQTLFESEMEIAIISEPYRHRYGGIWVTDSTGGVAIWACGRQTVQCTASQAASGFLLAKISCVYVYRCYAPIISTLSEFEQMLDNLVLDARGRSPKVIAGGFNAWALEWGIFLQQEESTDTFQPPPNETAIPPVTRDELLEICGRIGDNKAPGLDEVPNKGPKLAVKSRPDMFAKLFEVCMSEGIFAAAWKRQKLILLPKPGKNPGEPSSYRPICLLDTVKKMLERVIYNRLLPVVESQGGLSDRQYGFRKTRSTIDAIKLVTGLAENAIHGKGDTSKYCVVVTLDVKNAFNSANWNLIRKSLAKVGIPDYFAAIVGSY
ncbi:unnamed protein product [Hermetia illucens]|uniref:Reverse transcriptase domain-containing protein n=1 Tax=Hermetia illucens TaxID=343691 RepID=A0A7R8UJN6_HERIL|nr:unnamed protein product [Hermetia illucens]